MEQTFSPIHTPPVTLSTMSPIQPPISKKKYVVGLVLFSLIFVILAVTLLIFRPIERTSSDFQFQFGKNTAAEVEAKLGISISQKAMANSWQLKEYKNPDTQYNSFAIFDGKGKTQSFFYPLAEQKIDNYLDKYNQPEKIYYSNFLLSVRVAVWPQSGIAVWFDQDSGQAIFIREYKPTNLTDFIDRFGNGLKENS